MLTGSVGSVHVSPNERGVLASPEPEQAAEGQSVQEETLQRFPPGCCVCIRGVAKSRCTRAGPGSVINPSQLQPGGQEGHVTLL